MSYRPIGKRTVDVGFTKFPLGMSLKERWINDTETEIYVDKILSYNDSTKHIQPGYILTRVNEKRLENNSLHSLQTFLISQKDMTGERSPLFCTFEVRDPSDKGAPLFDPFHEKNDATCDTCDEQKTQNYEHDKMRMPMTTLPRGDSSSGAGACLINGGSGSGSGGVEQDIVLQKGSGGMLGESHWLNANDVINVNDLKKHMVNIDSEFRTKPVDPTSDFVVKLNPSINNAIRIRLVSAEIPNTYYEFSTKKRNTSFYLSSVIGLTSTIIEDGNYTPTSLQSTIQTDMTNPYKITIDPISSRTTISTSNNSVFTMDFRTMFNSTQLNPSLQTDPSYNWGLGYNLGFRQKYYTGSNAYTSENIVTTFATKYIFLKINDYYTVKQPFTEGNVLEAFTKIVLRSDKNTEVFNDSSDLLTREYVFSQPTNIPRIHVQLVDKYDQIIDFLGSPISIALEITEVMNCKLYDFYRNYLFQKKLKY